MCFDCATESPTSSSCCTIRTRFRCTATTKTLRGCPIDRTAASHSHPSRGSIWKEHFRRCSSIRNRRNVYCARSALDGGSTVMDEPFVQGASLPVCHCGGRLDVAALPALLDEWKGSRAASALAAKFVVVSFNNPDFCVATPIWFDPSLLFFRARVLPKHVAAHKVPPPWLARTAATKTSGRW